MRKVRGIVLIISYSFFLGGCAWPGAVFMGLGSSSQAGGSSPGFLALLGIGGNNSSRTLDRIQVKSADNSIAKGTSTQLTATAIYSDGSTENITSEASWLSSDTSLLLVSKSGTADSSVAVATGIVTVTGKYSGFSDSAKIEITAAELLSLEVTPTNPNIAVGTTRQFTATGIFTDGSQDLTADTNVTWTTTDQSGTAVASNTATPGEISGDNLGTSTITATYTGAAASGPVSGSTVLTVANATLLSIDVTPANQSIAKGNTLQFTATGNYNNSTTQDLTDSVVWSSSDANVAAISNGVGTEGLADSKDTVYGGTAGSSTGTAIITATLGAIDGTTNLTVTAATLDSITVTPVNPSIAKGLTKQFTATGNYSDGSTNDITTSVTWSSSDTTIAEISNGAGSKGLADSDPIASGTNTGTVTIKATSGSVDGTTSLTVTSATLVSLDVTPTTPSMSVSRTKQFTSTGTYTDSSTQNLTADSSCVWSSSDTGVATISNAAGSRGIVTSLSAGTTTIKHTCGSVFHSTTLTVNAATLNSIVVTPVNPSLAIGFTEQFTSVGIFSDNSNQILTDDATCSWSSSNTGVATISNASGSEGLASPVGVGTTTITHTCGAISGSTTLTITSATLLGITITPTNPTIANGTYNQFTATGTFSDNTSMNITDQVTWSSGNTGVATISNASGSEGYASSVGAGNTTITATHVSSGKSASTTLTVTNATLSSISITPTGAVAIGYGTKQQFTAVGDYSDGSTQTITDLVTWSSGNTSIATISNAAGSNGEAVSISAGTTNITATLGAVTSNTASLEVKIITLTSIAITPADPSVDSGSTQQFYATGTYNDGTQQDLTTQVTWNSADSGIAVISNTPGSMGVATATGTNGQSITISATRDGVIGYTTLYVISDVVSPTVNSASLQSGNILRVTFSEPVDVTQATDAANYLIAVTTGVSGSCSDNSNFTTSPSAVTVSSVAVVSSSEYLLTLASGTSSVNYTVIVDKTGVSDLVGNGLGCANSATFAGLDTVAPTVSSANSSTGTVVRVTFSENVNETEARTASNYKIVEAPAAGSCAGGDNFSSSVQTADFNIKSVSGSGNTYDVKLTSTQISGKSYTLIVDAANIHDLATTPNAVGCPNYADFTGLEQLKLSSVTCVDTTHVIASFSKDIKTGLNAEGSAECTTPSECNLRYTFSGGTSLGNIGDARVLDGTICGGAAADNSRVCITHTTEQGGGQYSLTVANDVDGDGFDNTSCGWGVSCSIRDSADTEDVQESPNDRRSFSGCATSPQNFTDGPISSDPFVDASDFGYLATYANKIYVGPNSSGSSASRFNPDGSSPEVLSFEFGKDTTGSSTSSNSATTRDGGIAVPPYVTMGHTGCTTNSANTLTGCGPDNENGRGLFATGTFSGTDYLFITGGKSGGNNDYLYYTSDTDSKLNFSYLDASDIFDNGSSTGGASISGNSVTESIKVMSGKIYWMVPGNKSYRPYFVKLNNLNQESKYANGDGTMLRMRYMDGFGYSGSPYNRADNVGGNLSVFNDRIYAMNSGAITNNSSTCSLNTSYSSGSCEQLGGWIRSNNNDPANCTSGGCTDWTDISPTSSKYRQYFTNVLTSLADLIPAEKPIPAIAEFNNQLFVIRNACQTSRWNWGCTGSTCSDDEACPSGQEIPQLWKCDPTIGGNTTECDANEWSLVAENGLTGKTNMGDSGNKKVSLLVTNGTRLYVGYDNANGVEIWRTMNGVTDPSSEADFEQIGVDGLGDTTNNLELYSGVSLSQDGVYYIYVSTGKSGQPLQVYRQQND